MKNTAIFLILLAFCAAPAAAEPGSPSQESQDKQIVSSAIRGLADVNLRDQAVLKLPAGMAFLPAPAAATMLARMITD